MPETKVISVDPVQPDLAVLEEAAGVIRRGGLVAFPTETVYGLGANSLDPEAVAAIFTAKGRPADNPVIVHVSRPEMLLPLVTSVPPSAEKLINRFWPGPLTLLFPKSTVVPDIVTAGLPRVAIRMPDHPVAHLLIDRAGVPVAAPSANVSGKPSPTSASAVLEDLTGKVDLVLDGGECEIGVESTVLDLFGDIPRILRPGGVTREEIEEILGAPVGVAPVETSDSEPSPSPGMKHRHYAPFAQMYLVTGDPGQQLQTAADHARGLLREGKTVAILSSSENVPSYLLLQDDFPGKLHIIDLGPRADIAKVASSLFASIRKADKLGVSTIISETFEEKGLGLAVSNRLRKASEGRVLRAMPERSTGGVRPLTVLFLCTGNTCRSPMAEALFRKAWEARGEGRAVRVLSRGVGAVPGMPATQEAREAMAKRGLDISRHSSLPLSPADVTSSDIIITMTRAHKERVVARFPQAREKTFTISEMASAVVPGDVTDPLGLGEQAYEETAVLLEKAVEQIIDRLASYPEELPGEGGVRQG